MLCTRAGSTSGHARRKRSLPFSAPTPQNRQCRIPRSSSFWRAARLLLRRHARGPTPRSPPRPRPRPGARWCPRPAPRLPPQLNDSISTQDAAASRASLRATRWWKPHSSAWSAGIDETFAAIDKEFVQTGKAWRTRIHPIPSLTSTRRPQPRRRCAPLQASSGRCTTRCSASRRSGQVERSRCWCSQAFATCRRGFHELECLHEGARRARSSTPIMSAASGSGGQSTRDLLRGQAHDPWRLPRHVPWPSTQSWPRRQSRRPDAGFRARRAPLPFLNPPSPWLRGRCAIAGALRCREAGARRKVMESFAARRHVLKRSSSSKDGPACCSMHACRAWAKACRRVQ